MTELHLPWLEVSVLIPLMGALFVSGIRDPRAVRKWSLVFAAAALFCTIGEWIDFISLATKQADDHWHFMTRFLGRELFSLDQLSAPLIPLVALIYFFTILTTLPTKVRRFSFSRALVSQSIAVATFSCKEPWPLIILLVLGTLPPYLELRSRNKPTRVFVSHMALFSSLLVVGWALVENSGTDRAHSPFILPLLIAVFVRCGIVPVHCWMTDLYENATFGTAVLFTTPIVGAYAAIRLLVPIAPDWVLRSMGLIALITAVYASGMAIVQKEARRFFCYLFLSHSALVLVGLDIVTPIGLTGALSVWLSVGISLVGFGLTLRALEARRGRLNLANYQGLYEHTPSLAVCFALTGLASVGFPGTVGFVGAELLVDGVVEVYPYVGIAVVIAAAMNGIAVVQAYFRLFTGASYSSSISLQISARERFAVLSLAALIVIGGLLPQPGVASRYRAAFDILRERQSMGHKVEGLDQDESAGGEHTRPESTHTN